MRGHAIAACAAAAVLSSAFAPAVGAQKPTKKDTVVAGGVPGPGGQLGLAELMKQLDARGAVRTGPNSDCTSFGGLRSPTCLVGVAPVTTRLLLPQPCGAER